MKLAREKIDTIIATRTGMQQVMLMGETFAKKDVSKDNNTVGREYAARQYERDKILGHLLRDSRVIREAK